MSKSTQPAAAKPRKKPFFTNDDLWGYAFIGVAVIFFLMFTIYPLISAVITSLEDYKPFGSDFVGLKNYQTTFTNALFWKSLKNTLVYTAVVVPLSLLISFSVAILIMPFKKKLQSVFKAMYYLPAVASGIALSVVWLWIYDSSPSGLFNQLLTFFHLPTQNWLGSSKTSMLSLMIMALLSGQGQNIIIYTAALLGIDNTYFEAAELDGASGVQTFRYITLPLLSPTTLFLLVTTFLSSMKVFQSVDILTSGGPARSTEVFVYLIYRYAMVDFRMDRAATAAVMFFLILLVITVLTMKVSDRSVTYDS